jgi:type VI secretion system secreted protein Hcp
LPVVRRARLEDGAHGAYEASLTAFQARGDHFMKTWMVRSVGIAALASTLALSTVAAAAADLFLKIDGIAGESVAAGHQKEIDVVSFNWGFLRKAGPGGYGPRGGAGAAKAAIEDFSVVKRVDAASPELVRALLDGRSIKSAVFVLQKAGGSKGGTEMIKITLENVQITDIKVSGNGTDVPTESVSLKFGKLTYDYTPIDAKGGKGPVISVTWDIAKNKS